MWARNEESYEVGTTVAERGEGTRMTCHENKNTSKAIADVQNNSNDHYYHHESPDNVGIALGLDFLKDFSTPPGTTKLALLEKRVAPRLTSGRPRLFFYQKMTRVV